MNDSTVRPQFVTEKQINAIIGTDNRANVFNHDLLAQDNSPEGRRRAVIAARDHAVRITRLARSIAQGNDPGTTRTSLATVAGRISEKASTVFRDTAALHLLINALERTGEPHMTPVLDQIEQLGDINRKNFATAVSNIVDSVALRITMHTDDTMIGQFRVSAWTEMFELLATVDEVHPDRGST